MISFLEKVWKTLISVKFAVVVIVCLAISLAVATVLESKYDTKTAQFVVYRSWWFYALLSSFGLLILAVAISRIPWKKKHIPFLMAHFGILMILIGSAITAFKGVDGNLRIAEGEVNSSVELDDHVLVFKRGDNVTSTEFPWMPAFEAEKFKTRQYPEFGVEVTKFVPDSELKIDFRPTSDSADKPTPAIQLRIMGAPMGGSPELWLWAGDASWSTQKMGPARFLIRREDQKDLAALPSEGPEARLDFIVGKKGDLRFEATSVRGEKRTGKIVMPTPPPTGGPAEAVLVDPEWRMPIKIAVRKFIPNASNNMAYVPVKAAAKGMNGGPVPAIQLHVMGDNSGSAHSSMWLGLGDRADLTTATGENVSVGYFPRRLVLPYALRLKKFEMKHNPGTMDPSAYSSHVQVVDQFQKTAQDLDTLPEHEISMNEPLKHGGYTFYQASYIPDFPRAVTTVLSVNYDPGRALKYLGSLLLVLGSILLYLSKLSQSKKKVATV
ncbi:MAG: cytochrome c biogenesis protein ResB [Bdellovibrionales bacterium]|nr:cytochrome c biogenesis protein ResB [Bdellovibrionales bacterium]